MKRVFTVLLIMFTSVFFKKAFSQSDTAFHFLKEYDYPVASFTVDNIGALYLITPENQLKKYDENGDSVGVFNQVTQYGTLTYVDAENPWKTILFYQNYSTIVLLDKYLKIVTAINLRKQNIFLVHAVTSSYDNNIWLFDEQDNKLKKMDDNGNILSETVDFRLLFDSVPEPKTIIDRDGFVYLYDPEKGVYIFDYYGSFKSRLPFLNWTNMEVFGKIIYGFDADHLYKYTPPLPGISTFPLPAELQNSTFINIANRKIYALKNGKVSVYSLP